MLLKYFYDPALAHASYLVGCQRTGEAMVVDPSRDIAGYLALAAQEGMRIAGAAETHIHADFVSGARELAEATGARLYLSDEGPADWKYTYAHHYRAKLLKHGDEFTVGQVRFTVVHTPGHTPEHVCYLLTDEGGGATAPMGLFTGDFIFVGSIGRPDLLETAVGVAGSAAAAARELYASIEAFRRMPDYLQLWPAHGAGSACGKGLGAVPSTTAGYENLFNPALQYHTESSFVDYILADQPETPFYFKVMKRLNKEGPPVLGRLAPPRRLAARELRERVQEGALVIDTRPLALFADRHAPRTINIPAGSIAKWAGWFVDYDQPPYLVADESQIGYLATVLQKIGVDCVAGYFDAAEAERHGVFTDSTPQADPSELAPRIASGEVEVIDVRAMAEWNEGHIPQAEHQFLGRLMQTADQVIGDRPIVVHCRSGGRSSIAASVLKARGARQVINMRGGFLAWQNLRLPVETASPAPVS